MNSSLYIGATGMKGLADGMHVITNNIANVSTIGFKQQDMLFSDVMYQTQASMGNWWNAQDDSRVAIGQVGMGLQIEAVRTKYTQGALQTTNTLTDLSINGKGFFQVTDGSREYFTRAGDFREDNEGVWRTPTGLALMGFQLGENGEKGALAEVQVDRFSTIPARATSNVSLSLNLNSKDDLSSSEDNPYFGLLSQYDGASATPLASGSYNASQAMTLYDAEGNPRTVTAYFDGAPSTSTNRYTEFVIADNSVVGAEGATEATGLLMSGVLEFDASGNLVNVSAFTPNKADSKELSDWTPAELVNGNPALTIGETQMNINFGLSAAGDWQGAPASAAAVGKDAATLGGMGSDAVKASYPTTAFATTAMTNSYKQDGYDEGYLTNVSVGSDGIISGSYSNGQNKDLWEIPLARFISEDGLYREGGNLFSATEESGEVQLGSAGTENFGEVVAYSIENSNVDLAQEMVSMIINQRGFQSNSKVVTTADEMLRKAMELKR